MKLNRLFIFLTCFCICVQSKAQNIKHHLFYGMYLQWGYNADCYTHSNIHFKMSNGDNFILHNAIAHDRGSYADIYKYPGQVSLPQYNYRIGFYLNPEFTKSIELNFDHAKYVVTDGQTVHVTGTIGGQHVDADSVLNPATFLHFEHTDGANWFHINYVEQRTLFLTKSKSHSLLNLIYKGGAGINIPRTDFTWKGDRLNNNFHVAGYNVSIEAGVRLFMSKHFFFESTGKTGYVRYIDALANTTTTKGNRASQGFAYLEGIMTLGYQFRF